MIQGDTNENEHVEFRSTIQSRVHRSCRVTVVNFAQTEIYDSTQMAVSGYLEYNNVFFLIIYKNIYL